MTLHPGGMAPKIINFDEWSGLTMHRVHQRATATADSVLFDLYDELATFPNVCLEPTAPSGPTADIFVPLRLATPEGELRFLATLSKFTTASDITLAELGVEVFYPADHHTAEVLRRLEHTRASATGMGPSLP